MGPGSVGGGLRRRVVRGASRLPPWVLWLVTVVQYCEDPTDWQAAAMTVRAIGWKYALGMELTDTGSDASVRSRFRGRLADNGMERVVLSGSLSTARWPVWWGPRASSAPTRRMRSVRCAT